MVFSSWARSVAFVKRQAELFSNVLQCFPTSRTSHRKSDFFGADLVDYTEDPFCIPGLSAEAKRENTNMGNLKVGLRPIRF
jgi:hypothetical protein